MLPWLAYILIYFYSLAIQLRFTLDLSKMINKHNTQNPNNLGLVMSNLAEIRCMRLESFVLFQHQEIFDFENRAKETTKMIGRIHGFFNTQLGRVLVELPVLLFAIRRPSILSSVSLAVLIGSTKQIQTTLEKLIFGYIKIQSNLQSLNRAKTFVEMEPEPGYGD